MQRTLLCAPSGCGLGVATERLTRHLRSELNLAVAWADVESHLGEPVRQIVRRPRPQAIEAWRQALREAIGELATSDAEVQLLSCHLTLFNGARSEFYSAVTPSIFSDGGFSPERLVILIDDIYDMYRRLALDDSDPLRAGLFAASLGEADFLAGEARELGFSRLEDLSPEQAGYLKTEYKVQVLTQLLAWRRAEMVQAELLASQLGAAFIPYGVKHTIEGLVTASRFTCQDSRTVYISHPISRPRRETRLGADWPPVVGDCNRLPEMLTRLRCVPVMPTAIDEYRLEQPTSGLFGRGPMLDRRWPKQATPTELIHCEEVSFSEEARALLLPEGYETMGAEDRIALASLLRALEASIEAEVPFRDHLIVAHAPDLLVYRPLYGDGTFSSGVEYEIQHWSELADAEALSRHIVFVHAAADVATALQRLEGDAGTLGAFQQYFLDDVRERLDALYQVRVPYLELVKVLRGGKPGGLLGKLNLSDQALAHIRRESLMIAATKLAYPALTSLDPMRDDAAVVVAKEPQDIGYEAYSTIADFLFGRAKPAPFDEALEAALADGLLGWGEGLVRRLSQH